MQPPMRQAADGSCLLPPALHHQADGGEVSEGGIEVLGPPCPAGEPVRQAGQDSDGQEDVMPGHRWCRVDTPAPGRAGERPGGGAAPDKYPGRRQAACTAPMHQHHVQPERGSRHCTESRCHRGPDIQRQLSAGEPVGRIRPPPCQPRKRSTPQPAHPCPRPPSSAPGERWRAARWSPAMVCAQVGQEQKAQPRQ